MPKERQTLNGVIYRVNKLLKQNIQNEVRRFDLTTDQWIILFNIYYNPGKYNQKVLAEVCFKERAAITRTITLMEKKNLIERKSSDNDHREYILFLTEEGKKVFEETLPYLEKTYDYIYKILGTEDVNFVIDILSRLEIGLMEKNK